MEEAEEGRAGLPGEAPAGRAIESLCPAAGSQGCRTNGATAAL